TAQEIGGGGTDHTTAADYDLHGCPKSPPIRASNRTLAEAVRACFADLNGSCDGSAMYVSTAERAAQAQASRCFGRQATENCHYFFNSCGRLLNAGGRLKSPRRDQLGALPRALIRT